jgi:hypothetical protein
MDLVEERWGDVDWIDLVEDRHRWRALVNSVLNLMQHCFNSCLLFYSNYLLHVSVVQPSSSGNIYTGN